MIDVTRQYAPDDIRNLFGIIEIGMIACGGLKFIELLLWAIKGGDLKELEPKDMFEARKRK